MSKYTKYSCPICGRPIPLESGIFIAGSICGGHSVSRMKYLLLLPRVLLWRLKMWKETK